MKLKAFLLALFPLLSFAQPISQLPPGLTPNGTETLPAVQSGGTVKLTTSQLAGYAQSSLSGVPNTALATMGSGTVKCNPSGGAASPTDCTSAQVNAIAGLVSGALTSTQVIANYPPASNGGRSVLTTDMTLMFCDGVRWNVIGSPPIPPGAAVFSYNKNVFTIFPTVSDVGSGNTPGQYRIYSGYLGINTSEPPVNSTTFTTASNGQLQLGYNGAGNINGIFTIVPFHTSALSSDYGQVGLALGSRGFYAEIAYTDSSNNTDCQDTLFVEPQEHNAIPSDYNPIYAAGWEQWHEFDVNECGHGTDYSGAYRGAYLKWSGHFSWSQTFASAPTGTITTFPALSTAWGGETGSFTITLSTGQQIAGNFTAGSTTVTCSSTTITGTPTSTFTTGYKTWDSRSILQTTSLDYTVEHIFGGAYDPVGQTWNIWQDGVFQGSVSTADAASTDAFRDSLHYMLVVAAQSHGAHVAHTMTVRYVSLWTP